ncbi:MAG: hypothetical protein OEZ34_16695 [Spirochaetia bacterium]|nr:hypothetical protein [Spirochaetia bacterium]
MFENYFSEKSQELSTSLSQNLEKRGIQLPGKEKDLTVFKELFTFLKEHLPDHYSLATGRVRNTKHVLNKNCDILIYNKWCQKFLDMTGGYILSDFVNLVINIEIDLTTEMIFDNANTVNALKSLYELENNIESDQVIPLYSVLFSYRSAIPLLSHKIAIGDSARENSISVNHQHDLIVVLDQGIIIKDWETGGGYKVIETGKDTLLWFYILLLEYMDRDGKLGFDPRKYINEEKVYDEF